MEIDNKYYNYLVSKAGNSWQITLAKICTFPVRLLVLIVNIYMGMALLFGLIAIVLFIGSFFDNSKFSPITIILLYVPFFVVILIGFCFSKVQFLKRIGTPLLFIICNLIIYIIPLIYGGYKLRYMQVESYLQDVEYNKNRDLYCEELIDAYSKRTSLFRVWVKNHMICNGHVGHEWGIHNSFNSLSIEGNPHIIELSEDDTIEVFSQALEYDVYNDYGCKTTCFKIPWSLLLDRRNNFSHNVFVMEHNGRFAGNISEWVCTYYIERYSEANLKYRKQYNIPKDSIMKHIFDFGIIYVPKYKVEDRPWEKYMTYSDKYELSQGDKNFDLLDRTNYNESSEYAIKPLVK